MARVEEVLFPKEVLVEGTVTGLGFVTGTFVSETVTRAIGLVERKKSLANIFIKYLMVVICSAIAGLRGMWKYVHYIKEFAEGVFGSIVYDVISAFYPPGLFALSHITAVKLRGALMSLRGLSIRPRGGRHEIIRETSTETPSRGEESTVGALRFV